MMALALELALALALRDESLLASRKITVTSRMRRLID